MEQTTVLNNNILFLFMSNPNNCIARKLKVDSNKLKNKNKYVALSKIK